jgi:predicted nucleotidyltransferase component of viral defense system
MVKWISVPTETKVNAYQQISETTGMSAFAVEKDWWVVQALSVIFEMNDSKYLVFKGGTSLSKAWGLIERFSEDVDLAIDRAFFHFEKLDATGKVVDLSRKQITELRKEASRYTSGIFLEELKRKFTERGINGLIFKLVETTDSDQDPRIIEIYYPNVIQAPDYLEARVQIEIGCRSLKEPFTVKTFSSLVDEHYSEMDFALPPIQVPSVNPERTFLEKIFLLHEEFQRPIEKIRVERLSRHLYDVVKLSKTEFAEKALTDKELYETIVIHRHKFTRIAGIDYNLHQVKTINPIPIPEVITAWKTDYNKMIEQMIYEENPLSFEEIIDELTLLRGRINALDWAFNESFSAPHKQ